MKPAVIVECFSLHRGLCEQARAVMRRLPFCARDARERLRRAICCMVVAGERALGARDESEALRSWLECELGERQIRVAAYRALRKRAIADADYEALFAVANQASRARRQVLVRLRRRMRLLLV